MLQPELERSLQSDLGKYLNAQELQILFAHNKVLTFSAGEIILQQGKESNGIYVIIDGFAVAVAKILGEGTAELETLGRGDFLGEISFIEKIPCATSSVAKNQVQTLFISVNYMNFLSAYFPEIKYKLFRAISEKVCNRLKKMHDKIIAIISNSTMVSSPAQSLFVEIINSLTRPVEMKVEENNMHMNKLQQFAIFHSFSQDELTELFKHSVLLNVAKDCTLIHKGEKDAACYIVIHGAVQSSIVHENKVAKLSVIGPATLFAGIACVDDSFPFTITFASCEQAVLLKISKCDLLIFQGQKPTLWYKIFDLICRSLVALEKSVDKLDIRLSIETYNR
ncbi:MAG TPA: cyclic nucleotide-binding domain-containing protein [Gammaproteobacteria bacterium]|jgi:CRP-like cAMP-binding protein|nr:cyclic nucleotide-binding domain-containing protein [Gammaproteobacteria bacterium]